MTGFLMVMGFLAAFIDAIVGGGGLITVPALMCTGMPLIDVLGTNKGASVMGAVTSFVTFVRSGKVNLGLIKYLFPCSLIGSAVGVFAVKLMPADILRPLVIVMLILVTAYSLFKKDWGETQSYCVMTKKMLILCMLVAFIFGFYDGFFGPGTGSFLIFSFIWLGFDFIMAAGNARALNFASNMAAAILFGSLGAIKLSYALPMGIAMIIGAWCGAKMALKKGTAFVKPLFIIMTVILIGKQLWQLIGG